MARRYVICTTIQRADRGFNVIQRRIVRSRPRRRALADPAARRRDRRRDRARRAGPGEKLPPTRELAELAGINHLTAVRAYRRLRELGLVSAHVGRGTFVREAAAAPARGARLDRLLRYALPESNLGYGDRVLSDMHRQATSDQLIPLSVGYPSARLFPVEEISEAVDATLREEPERALQYWTYRGSPTSPSRSPR